MESPFGEILLLPFLSYANRCLFLSSVDKSMEDEPKIQRKYLELNLDEVN